MQVRNALTEWLGIPLPVIQAPMGGGDHHPGTGRGGVRGRRLRLPGGGVPEARGDRRVVDAVRGDAQMLSPWSGQGGPLGRREPAAAIVARTVRQFDEVVQALR